MPGTGEVGELVELFGRVTDPRKPRGVRHRIAAVLTVTVFAVLGGAANYRQVGDAVADLPQELLALAAGTPAPAYRLVPAAQRADDPPGRGGYRRRAGRRSDRRVVA